MMATRIASIQKRGDDQTPKSGRAVFYALLTILVVVPLAMTPHTAQAASPAKWLIIETCAPALAVAWLIRRSFSGQLSLRWSFITVAALAVLASQIVSLIVATNRWLTCAEIVKQAGLLAAYFLTANIISRNADRDKLLWAITASGCAAALYGVAQHFGFDFFLWQEVPETLVARGVSTFGHANFAAHYLVMAIPLSVSLVVTRRSVLSRLVAFAFTVVMLCHFSITGTRGASLGLVAASVIVATVLLHARIRGREPLGTNGIANHRRIVGWSAVVAAIALVAVGGVMVVRAWSVKGSDTFAIRERHGLFRLHLWRSSTRLFLKHPILGIGAGNYEVISPTVWDKAEIDDFVKQNKMSYRVHNEYLETATEQGIIGFAALTGLIVVACYEACQILRETQARADSRRALGLLAAVVALSVDSVFNFDLQTPSSALLFWVALGMITSKVSQLRSCPPEELITMKRCPVPKKRQHLS